MAPCLSSKGFTSSRQKRNVVLSYSFNEAAVRRRPIHPSWVPSKDQAEKPRFRRVGELSDEQPSPRTVSTSA